MIDTSNNNMTLTMMPLGNQYWPKSTAEINRCSIVPSGTEIYYTLPRTGNLWYRVLMLINDERQAIATAYRRHYLPEDATVVATEPYYVRRNYVPIS